MYDVSLLRDEALSKQLTPKPWRLPPIIPTLLIQIRDLERLQEISPRASQCWPLASKLEDLIKSFHLFHFCPLLQREREIKGEREREREREKTNVSVVKPPATLTNTVNNCMRKNELLMKFSCAHCTIKCNRTYLWWIMAIICAAVNW